MIEQYVIGVFAFFTASLPANHCSILTHNQRVF